jgi:cytochrome c oxidase cbb3-type subunit 4
MSDDTLNLLRAVTTVLAFVAFVGVVAWAWSRRRRDEFEQAANLPLEEDDTVRPVTSGHTTSSRGASDREAT